MTGFVLNVLFYGIFNGFMFCLDAPRMETCSSTVTGDVVIIGTLDWFLKRNLTIFDQSCSSDVHTANRKWKTVTSDSFLERAGFCSPPSGQRGDAQASEL